MRTVDTHFHWFPRSHFEFMAARTEFPRTERVGDGYRYYYNEGRRFLPLPAVWYDLDAGLAEAEAATGPDTVVVCTTGVLSGLLDQLSTVDSVDCAFAYNEEIAKAARTHRDKFYGTAAVPLRDTTQALAVLDHAVQELDLRAVNLPPVTSGDPIDIERLDPFYARVAELGVPLIIHPTDLVFGEMLADHGDALQRTLGRLFDSSITVLRLIFGGILERYPDLKVIHTHGGGLLPYQAGRVDKNARQPLPLQPSEYLKRIFVDTVTPQALTVRTALEFYGPDKVIYGTDYPCWSPRAAVDVLAEAELSEEQRTRILATNVDAVLNLA